MWHMHLHVIRACDVPALVKSVLSYIYVVCVPWLISVDLVCISRVILCCYVLEVSHSLVCCDLWTTTSSWSSPGLHHRPHFLEVDFFACSCVCSCAYLWHALLFYVFMFGVSFVTLLLCYVRCICSFACFVVLQFRWFSACDAALCVIAIYGKLPNCETSLFGSCMLCCVYTCDAYALPNSPHALFA